MPDKVSRISKVEIRLLFNQHLFYSGFQLQTTEIRYLGAQRVLKIRRALGRVSRLQLQTTAICYV
jgi:hypothetical protein